MKKMSFLTKCITTAMCTALCIVLPMALHAIPNAGVLLSPMHLPVLLCGLVCGWPFGLLCGLLSPLLSSLITSMPPMAILPSMMIELAVYGTLSGLMMKLVRTGKLLANLYISLLTAMIAGRIAAGLSKAFLFAPGEYSLSAWATAYFVSSFPGILLQLLLLPAIYIALKKARLTGE